MTDLYVRIGDEFCKVATTTSNTNTLDIIRSEIESQIELCKGLECMSVALGLSISLQIINRVISADSITHTET